jgi:LacI family transcriptional regulator
VLVAGLTSRDVAKAAGVSQATVSNVLNRPHLVSAATLEKVRDTMRSMGFVVNDSARTLRAGRSRTLGVIILDLANPFWGEVMRGIEAAATPHDYSVLFGSSDEQPGKEQHLLRLFHQHRVHAVLVSSLEDDSGALQALRDRGTQIVLVDKRSADGRDSSVSSDDIAGARQAMGHLLDLGHRRIAFVNGPHEVPWCADRFRGAALEISERGLDVRVTLTELTIPSMTAQAAEAVVDRLLAVEDVTAVFCANDLVALGLLRQLSVRGVRVPDDLSLVGYDDSYVAALLSPALTTVRQEPFLIGKYAAQIAITSQSDDTPEARVLEPILIERQSVRRVDAAAKSLASRRGPRQRSKTTIA